MGKGFAGVGLVPRGTGCSGIQLRVITKVTKEDWLEMQEREAKYLSCAESHHEVSNESVFSLPRAVAHHHPPAIRLCQFASVWEEHLMRSNVTSVKKPGAGKADLLLCFRRWVLECLNSLGSRRRVF